MRTAVHAGGEELQHQNGAETVHDQAAEAVALGVDEAIGVGDGVEAEPAAAQLDGPADAAGEEGVVHGSAASAVRMRRAMREWPL